MATKPKSEAKSPPPDTRGKIVDALMELAAERRFEDISVRDICKTAGVSLADFRDAFPSKGAVLAGFTRRIDRAVLAEHGEELADETPRERLFDILMRRLEAMAPYREGVREAAAWLRREPAAALAMNQVVMSSMRFMLEAAGIEAEGAAGVDQAPGPGARLGAHDPGLARRRRPRPVQDHGGAGPRPDAGRAGGRGRRSLERAGEPVRRARPGGLRCGPQGAARRRPPVAQGRPRRRGRDRALSARKRSCGARR